MHSRRRGRGSSLGLLFGRSVPIVLDAVFAHCARGGSIPSSPQSSLGLGKLNGVLVKYQDGAPPPQRQTFVVVVFVVVRRPPRQRVDDSSERCDLSSTTWWGCGFSRRVIGTGNGMDSTSSLQLSGSLADPVGR